MKQKKMIIAIVLILIIAIILPYNIFSVDTSWLVRYEYDSEIIKDLQDQANNEQEQVNVEPQGNVFDIIIFMGQSNMVGQGDASQAVTRINDRVGFEMEFNLAGEPYGLSKIAEPFGDTYGNVDTQPTDWPEFSPSTGSIVTSFMNAYYLNTGVPVVGIPAAISGTSIYDYWQDGQIGLETAKTKYEKTYQWMKDNGYKVRHSYMVWYQGEADVGQYTTDSDGNRTYTNGTITYENAFKNTITEMQNVGIERSFLISIGGYYVREGYENDGNKTIYTNYQEMIQHQKEICETNDWVTLVSTRAGTLTKCEDMITADENGYIYGVHLNQKALDIVGSEAGKNVAKYADQARGKTLTQKQSEALINFGKQFAEEGTKAKKLVYGINNKAAAYNLQLVRYNEHTTESGTQLIWFGPTGKDYGWNGETDVNDFVPNDYIGLDCSGFVAFLYHHVFGLPFNYKYNNMINPWTTKEFIENREINAFDGETIEAFKVVYEQHAKEQKYTLNDLASLADLQPGDLLIGRGGVNENDNTNHIVIYSGKKDGENKILHATSSAEHYFGFDEENEIYYNMGECDLDKSIFRFRNVYVYRLNDNIIPQDYVYNTKPIDWTKLSTSAPYDDMNPIIEKTEGNPAEWTNQDVTITVTAKDDGKVIPEDDGTTWLGIGLAEQAYSFDGGQTWQKSKQKTFSENCSVNIQVRDAAGNISQNTVEIIKIDKTAPTAEVCHSTTDQTNQNVTVTITANEEIQAVNGWTLSEDKLVLTKEYSQNATETVTIKDIAGNETTVEIRVTGIKGIFKENTYEIKDSYITKIKPNITYEDFIKNIQTTRQYKVTENSKEVTGKTLIKTGQKFIINNKTYTLVVTGDVNGDGKTNIVDLSRLKLAIVGKIKIEEEYKEASDINNDGQALQITDLSKMKLYLVGK